MTAELRYIDEVVPGKKSTEKIISFPLDRVSVRELITQRVAAEVAKYNNRQDSSDSLLIRPKTESPQMIDANQQIAKAIESFGSSSLLLLVNDKQIENLDDVIHITPNTVVTFLKLVPLVGG